MLNRLAAAGVLAALLVPSAALAQESCQEHAASRTTGTVVGAAAGALLGGAVAGRHDRVAGAVVGGLAGGVIGNQLTKGPRDCAHAYGWYDDEGRWHANQVDPAYAHGYYDRTGAWVEGEPAAYQGGQSWAPERAEYDADDWTGYPDLGVLEARVRGEIIGGVGEDLIDPDTARDLMAQLGGIEVQEGAEYRVHGRSLPPDDRLRLRNQLENLDREVDSIRAEP